MERPSDATKDWVQFGTKSANILKTFSEYIYIADHPIMAFSAARGVSQVMNRCEDAKTTGYLDLSECELMYLADALYMVLRDFQIQRCNLRNNKLKKFPLKLIAKFPDIDVINLEGNQLEELPLEIGNWKGLRGINVSRNRLTEFPMALLECRQLTLLDLSGNAISDFNAEILRLKLPSLKQLNIRDCPLSAEQIGTLSNGLAPNCKVVHK